MMFFCIWGVLLWLGATIIFRFMGHWLINGENLLATILTFAAALPVIALTTLPVYRWRRIGDGERLLSAVSIALPGMLLDIFTLLFYPVLLPNLSLDILPIFGAWLFWAYILILFTGLIPIKKSA